MNKVVNSKLNLGFAIYLALIPLMVSVFDLFKFDFKIIPQIVTWGIVYFVVLMISLVTYLLKGNKLNFQIFKKPLYVLGMLMFVWVIISSCINSVFNLHLLTYLSYFAIFACIFSLSKRKQLLVLNVLISVVAICCIMGFIDPYGKFMPGFDSRAYNMSLQFVNPNYIAYVLCGLSVICFVFFNNTKGWKQWFYGISYLIFAISLFVNGSFMPISALIFVEVIIQVVIGVKNKKLQYKMLTLFLILIPICFLVDLIPNIEQIRTCAYNYFIECIAVFDNIFNTNILNLFNIKSVAGADGWNRTDLISQSINYITSSPKILFFGGGAGKFAVFRPHNAWLSLTMDFGIILPMLIIATLVFTMIKMIKNKLTTNAFIFAMSIIAFMLCYIMGSVIGYSFYIFVIILAIFAKQLVMNE